MKNSHVTLVLLAILLSLGPATPLPREGVDDSSSQSVRVSTDDADVRRHPNRAAPIVSKVPQSVQLPVTGTSTQGDYYQVQLKTGERAWIHRSLVEQTIGGADLDNLLVEGASRGSSARDSASQFAERHLALGRPQLTHVRGRQGYVTAVSGATKIPMWVQYTLRPNELFGPGDRDRSSFRADASLPQLARASLSDYRVSGHDRGHMAPAADMKRSQGVMDESFFLSNMAPQVGRGFNRDIWRHLEEATRDWVRQRGELTIVAGPVFEVDRDNRVSYGVVGENQVAVPNAFFKVIVDAEPEEDIDALAFIIPNRPLFGRRYDEFLVSIDEVEAATGIDLLSKLPSELQETIESEAAASPWSRGRNLLAAERELANDIAVRLIEFGDEGQLIQPQAIERLVADAGRINPSHIFVLAHGWNNSRIEAEQSYQSVLAMMAEAAEQRSDLRPTTYRPLVVGVQWPSKAWDEHSDRVRALTDEEDLTLAIIKVLPSERSPETHLQDVMYLRDLMNRGNQQVTAEEYQNAWQIMCRYSLDAVDPQDETIFDVQDRDATVPRGSGSWSVRDLFRVFTFWQMKKRAGTVGAKGGGELLSELTRRFPDAEIHLGGHSFGCKFWLSALSRGRRGMQRDVDSLILVQGAVSAFCFADDVPGRNVPGGYRDALDAVSGPVVVTHSKHDRPLRWAYPLGSRLANQTGELERGLRDYVSRFAALGAVGAVDGGPSIRLDGRLGRYDMRTGLNNVDGGDYIDAHSGFYNLDVARLFWSAILSGGNSRDQ